jgi:hypothetical protein
MAKQPNTPSAPNAPASSTPNTPAPGINGQAGTDSKLSAVTATAADSENSEQTLGDANAGNAGNATQAVAAAQLATAEADRLRAENEDLRRKLTEATTTPRAAQAVAAAQGSLVVTAAAAWFSVHLLATPDSMRVAVFVPEGTEEAAKRRYCDRMGVVWDPKFGASTVDHFKILPIEGKPPAADLRGKYRRDELTSLGYSAEELDDAAI